MVAFSKPTVPDMSGSDSPTSVVSPHSKMFNSLFAQFGGGRVSHAALDNPYDDGEFLISFNGVHSFIHHDINVSNDDGTVATTIKIIGHGSHVVSGSRFTVNFEYVEDEFSAMTGAIPGSSITLTPHSIP